MVLAAVNLIIKPKHASSIFSSGYKDAQGLNVDSVFATALKEFSIPDTSLKQARTKKSIIPHKYTVTLTGDLPVPLILHDLQSRLAVYGIEVVAHEARINGDTDIELISSDRQVIFHADVTINKTAVRSNSKVSIIIQGLDEASLSNKKKFCADIEETAFILLPSKENRQIVSLLRSKNNECIIELSDQIPDQEYKLLDEFTSKRLKQSIAAIDSDIPGVFAYYVNTQSKFYHSPKFQLIKSALNGKKLLTDRGLYTIPYQNDDKVFQDAVSNILFRHSNHPEATVLVVDYRNYPLLAPYMAKFIKKGGKVVKLTAAIS